MVKLCIFFYCFINIPNSQPACAARSCKELAFFCSELGFEKDMDVHVQVHMLFNQNVTFGWSVEMFLKPAGALANVQNKDQPAVEMFKTYWNSRSHWDVDWCFTFVSYRVLIHWLEKLAIQLLLQVYNPTGETVGILEKIMTSLWLLHLHLRTSNWLCFFSDGIPLDGPKTTAASFHWTCQ